MATTPRFPVEILGLIVDNLAPEALAESHTCLFDLKACSLARRTLFELSRKHIFSCIQIDTSYHATDVTFKRFLQLISETPALSKYIMRLDIDFSVMDSLDAADSH